MCTKFVVIKSSRRVEPFELKECTCAASLQRHHELIECGLIQAEDKEVKRTPQSVMGSRVQRTSLLCSSLLPMWRGSVALTEHKT